MPEPPHAKAGTFVPIDAMPDSKALSTLLLAVCLAGAGVLAHAIAGLSPLSAAQGAAIVVLAICTIVSGRFAIQVPGRSATVSVSEVFVFMAILLFGPGPASLIVAVDGFLTSIQQKRLRPYRVVFNVAEPAISVFCAGVVFETVARTTFPSTLLVLHPALFLATLAMAGAFFALNSGLLALAIALESGSAPIAVWKGFAVNLAANFYAAAALAALALPDRNTVNLQAIGFIVPLLVVSYLAYAEAAKRVDGAERHASEVERLYSEARKRDDAMRQAQKLEAIGRLAGGVAHDFNNMLMAIRGYGELVFQALPGTDPSRADVEEILKAADRAAGLTRQLLAFSRRHVVAPQVIRPEQVVTAMDKMIRRLIGEDVVLTTRLAPDVARICMDQGHLEQVLMNLAVNARDAMPNGGQISMELTNVHIAADGGRGTTLRPGQYVVPLGR